MIAMILLVIIIQLFVYLYAYSTVKRHKQKKETKRTQAKDKTRQTYIIRTIIEIQELHTRQSLCGEKKYIYIYIYVCKR
jgi:uncharacterized membrane protein